MMAEPKQNFTALTEFLSNNTRVNALNSEKDLKKINKDAPQIFLVGAPWCGYSQLTVPQFDVACEKEDEPHCHLIDGTSDEGKKIVTKLGLDVDAFPTLIIRDPNAPEDPIKIVGMRNVPQMQEAIRQSKTILGEKKVGSRTHYFPV